MKVTSIQFGFCVSILKLLDEAAMQAVRDWEFEPARIGPLPVEAEIEVPVRFEFEN